MIVLLRSRIIRCSLIRFLSIVLQLGLDLLFALPTLHSPTSRLDGRHEGLLFFLDVLPLRPALLHEDLSRLLCRGRSYVGRWKALSRRGTSRIRLLLGHLNREFRVSGDEIESRQSALSCEE